MTKPIKAELSLQRSNQDHKTISLRLRFGTGKTVTVGMKPYDFALMVTGMSDVDCQVELRNVRLEMESQEAVTDKNFTDLSTEIMLNIMLKGQAKINVRDFVAVAKETDPFELAHFIEGNDFQIIVVRKED